MAAETCHVCFTISWEPTQNKDECRWSHGEADEPHKGDCERCGYCWLAAQAATVRSERAALYEALHRAFVAMGRAGANADVNHPLRAEWLAARAALAQADGGKP